ncbi:MAG: putative selenate reductase subunit YgfK [Oscillospiraceae bacterium]|nr:putative selenate reductase subunit YgfK [Oscillospiraceae bacterium]
MSDKMTPIPFGNLMDWVLKEKKTKGTVFGIKRPYIAEPDHDWSFLGGKLETPFGPAAGPHTQLAQNIIAAYYTGSRFFELKTVQILDGEDLPVSKPCIKADDEGYNVEWSTELYVPQAFDEYVKAFFVLNVISKEFGLGNADGFQFNMSVGYDLEGIKTPKINRFIEDLKDASKTPIYNECMDWLKANSERFEKVTAEDIKTIPETICKSVTLSTLHGCPPQEIERIAAYLMTEKKLHTFVKCNPTLLGYEYARSVLDKMGYDYVSFGEFHFKDDLQYEDAVPMLKRLKALAEEQKLQFGVKITNTFPVDICAGELPGKEMYMSGKSLFALSMSVAEKLAKDFDGKLRISFSGGLDYFNIEEVVATGIFPVTLATTLLKPGGYQRLEQIAGIWSASAPQQFRGVDAAAVSHLVQKAIVSKHHVKSIKTLPSRKMNKSVPLIDCFTAPCQQGCPIKQDTTTYMKLAGEGKMKEALEVIVEKNPLPFITGTICSHNCMTKCVRNFYESPVNIRAIKLEAAKGGFDSLMNEIIKPEISAKGKTAVVGGGPAGLSAAYFLAKGGMEVTIFEKRENLGGVVRNVIPNFRIDGGAIDNDIKLVRSMGVKIETGKEITSIDELKKDYENVVLAVGASEQGVLKIGETTTWNAIDFLESFKQKNGEMDIGKQVVVIGGGNTAMDTARAAKRTKGVEKAVLIYRRTKRYMPADEEEIRTVIEDGIEIHELYSPLEMKNGQLVCKKMKMGALDASGRPGFEETNEEAAFAADTVISAVGERIPKSFYENNGISLDDKGRVIVNESTLESSVKGIYIIGDGLKGPATVVEAIRDARKAAEGILGKAVARDFDTEETAETIYGRKGVLKEEDKALLDSPRCLECVCICENCVEVCPNRANVSITVKGKRTSQIVHVDYMCNECGNCKSFCPYDSAPYLDKFTLFSTVADMENSNNKGFVVLDKKTKACKVRLEDTILDYTVGEKSSLIPEDIGNLISAVISDYDYLLINVTKR